MHGLFAELYTLPARAPDSENTEYSESPLRRCDRIVTRVVEV